jgi:1-acyl-sn-glycerol-3-phosphate acyltransferase
LARLWRIVGIVLVLSTYFSLAPFGYVAFGILSLFPTKDRDARARRLQSIVRFAFGRMHDVLRVLRILDFDRREGLGQLPDTACIFVANHPTLTDTSALLATTPNLVTVVKPSIFRNLMMQPLFRQAGYFEGTSGGPASLGRVLDEGLDRLTRGYHVLLFPEGTRSPAGAPGRFGRTPFELAVRAGVPIVPLVIECTPRWLSKDHSFLSPPSETPRLRIRALSPVHPDAAGACSRTLRDMVSDAVLEALKVQ